MNQPFNTNGGIHEIPLPTATGRLFLCGKHYIGPNVEDQRGAILVEQPLHVGHRRVQAEAAPASGNAPAVCIK